MKFKIDTDKKEIELLDDNYNIGELMDELSMLFGEN